MNKMALRGGRLCSVSTHLSTVAVLVLCLLGGATAAEGDDDRIVVPSNSIIYLDDTTVAVSSVNFDGSDSSGTFDIGNGFCNDAVNSAEFQYDGGDCCSCTCVSGTTFDCTSGFDCLDPDADCEDDDDDEDEGDDDDGDGAYSTVQVIIGWSLIAGGILILGLCLLLCFKCKMHKGDIVHGNTRPVGADGDTGGRVILQPLRRDEENLAISTGVAIAYPACAVASKNDEDDIIVAYPVQASVPTAGAIA